MKKNAAYNKNAHHVLYQGVKIRDAQENSAKIRSVQKKKILLHFVFMDFSIYFFFHSIPVVSLHWASGFCPGRSMVAAS
jgi:hypothetical protein